MTRHHTTILESIEDAVTGRKASGLLMAVLLTLALSVLAVGPAAATSHDVAITVTDSNGNTIDSASVEIVNTADGTVVETGTTDSSGYYETTLSDGDYDISVTHSDYESSTQTISHTSGTVSTVDVSLTESTGTIETTVTDSNGSAIGSASVDVINPSDGSIVATGTTDSTGVVSTVVPTGTYDVAVNADGYQSSTTTGVEVTQNTVTTTSVSLSESTTTGNLEIVAEDSDGNTVANATVDVIDPSTGTIVASSTTDSAGITSFSSLETGTYDVEVSHADYQLASLSEVEVMSDSTINRFATLLTPGEQLENREFVVNGSEGTPSALSVELAPGTYDVTWYESNTSDDTRTNLHTETVNVTDSATVQEFIPENISDAADGDTFGVEVSYNTNDDPDAAVVSSGVLYGGDVGGGGGSTDGSSFPVEVILAGVLVVLVGGILLFGFDD